ncbi:hypothetical protein L7F22_025722 [Adiantum nelumboides]|nr:hypothetical protein [Adiantum nelumboides]
MLHYVDQADVDFVVPFVAMMFQGMLFEEVLLDGGSGLNTLPEEVYRSLKLGGTLSPAPFQVKMADQRRVQPLGILKQQAIEIAGKKSVTISMQGRKQIPPKIKPLCAQTINLADAVEDDEEEEFLRANPTIFSIFEVDVERIIQKDEEQGEDEIEIVRSQEIVPSQEIAGSEVLQMMDRNSEVPQKVQIDQEEKEARIMAENIYEKRFAMPKPKASSIMKPSPEEEQGDVCKLHPCKKGVVLRVDVSDPKDEVELLPEEEVAPMSSSKMLQSMMEPFSDFRVEIDCQADRNEKWLKATGAISEKVHLSPGVVAQGKTFGKAEISGSMAEKLKTMQDFIEAGYTEEEAKMVLASPEHKLLMGDLLKNLEVEAQTPSRIIGKTFSMPKKRKLDASLHEVAKSLDFSPDGPSSCTKPDLFITDVPTALKMLQELQGFVSYQ